MSRCLISSLVLGAVAGLCGCAMESVVAPLASSKIDFVSPALRGAENGLEMHWWVVEGSPELLRAAVAPFAGDPCGVPEEMRRSLAESGMRLVRVPLTELSTIREGLKLRGRTDRKWLGQAPWWIEALRGSLMGESVAMSEGRVISLPSGRLRVLARAWTSPGAEGPVMRADIAIQHLPRISELLPSLTAGDAERMLEPQRQGPVFDESLASLEMEEGYAYLLVCDAPDAVWPGDEVAVDPLVATYTLGQCGGDELDGPPTLSVPTLGERLLRQPGTPLTGESSMTAVVVLAPRLPERFTLLP